MSGPSKEPWTLLRVLDWTTQRFTDAKLGAPRLEAQVLLGKVLGLTRVQLYTQFDRPLAESELAAYRELIKRRLAGEPAAYLVGEQEFWSQPFWVDASVLVPRRDTETVIELVLDQIPAAERAAPRRVLDLCTGAGALAVILAKELPGAHVIATDVSPAAIAIAGRNAERAGVAARVALREGDLWTAVDAAQDRGVDDRSSGGSGSAVAGGGEAPFDLIVANPPYVRTGELAGLSPEVRREPVLALDGGADGLDVIRPLVAGLAAHAAAGALVAIEHGFDQGADVRGLLDATGAFVPAITRDDLAGKPRVTWTRRAPPR
jgi:release factor glutamine methyltransferase